GHRGQRGAPPAADRLSQQHRRARSGEHGEQERRDHERDEVGGHGPHHGGRIRCRQRNYGGMTVSRKCVIMLVMSTERARRAPAPHERQRDPERTKARILDAATAEFSAKGFAGARVSEIAKRAGVNQQLIAYYFDGKEGLYREIGRRWRAYEAQQVPDDMPFA